MRNVNYMWNRRAVLLGESFSSVMEQSFPQVVNKAVHDIHIREILRAMPEGTKRVLDVGCGWGRIATDVAQKQNVHVSGIDISSHFVKLFNKRLKEQGKAVVGDMRQIPFGDNVFDLVYCVVSLMYLSSKQDQKKALTEIMRVLKKDGVLILIEPNYWGVQLVRLGGLVPFMYRIILGKPKVETYGGSFYIDHLETLIRKSKGMLIEKKGYPFLTLFLLPAVFIGRIFPKATKIVLQVLSFFDQLFNITSFSYFVTWIIKKTTPQ